MYIKKRIKNYNVKGKQRLYRNNGNSKNARTSISYTILCAFLGTSYLFCVIACVPTDMHFLFFFVSGLKYRNKAARREVGLVTFSQKDMLKIRHLCLFHAFPIKYSNI